MNDETHYWREDQLVPREKVTLKETEVPVRIGTCGHCRLPWTQCACGKHVEPKNAHD